MGGLARRGRFPGRPDQVPAHGRGGSLQVICGADVVLAGLFSARQKDQAKLMEVATGIVASLGGRVVAQVVRRRGVSDGGVAAMSQPLSRKTLVSQGKAREIAAVCDAHGAAAVAFANPLTTHQQQALADILGRPVISLFAVPASSRGRPADSVE